MTMNHQAETITQQADTLSLSIETMQGDILAFPTDTVYGLGCVVTDGTAIQRLYDLKGRDETKPLILMSDEPDAFTPYVRSIPSIARRWMREHWPGALTIVLPKSEQVSDQITRGHNTVGLRVPNCPVFWQMVQQVPGRVLATTSANRSGLPACTTAACIKNQLGDAIDYLLENDAAVIHQQASTVVSVTDEGDWQVLRQGAVVLD